MAVKNAVAKNWYLATNGDGTKNSAYPNGDKPYPPTLGTPTITSDGAIIPYSGGLYTTLTPRWSDDEGVTWTEIADVTASPITFSGLPTGSYDFQVYINENANLVSNTVTAIVPSLLTAPTLTGPTQVNSTTLRVGISGGAGATSWTLEKSTDGGSSWTSAGGVTVGATQADATVTTGQSTQLRIAATAGATTVYSNVVVGTASAGSGAEPYFESALTSFTGWDYVGGAWSIVTDPVSGNPVARCAYNGQNTGPYQLKKDIDPTKGEFWLAFDTWQSVTTVSAKTCKLFGTGYPTLYQNITLHNGYTGAWWGIAYGNNPTGSNDTTSLQTYTTTGSADSRSTPSYIYRKGESLPHTTIRKRYFFHVKQNTSTTIGDAELQVWVDSFDGNGKVLWLDIRGPGFFLRGDASYGFQSLGFGDYTSTSTPFYLYLANVVISYIGMPD